MLIVGNTGCAVWFNLIFGAFGIIGGLAGLASGSKDAGAILGGGVIFLIIGLICAAAKSDREKKAAEIVNQVYSEAYQQAAQDMKAELERKRSTTCTDCNHENQEGWTFCSSCGSKRSA